jgi:ZIP family zinc transporter
MLNYFMGLSLPIMSLIATIFTWSITALGSAIVFFFKKINHNILDMMMSLSAGIMLAASYWSLLEPAIEKAKFNGSCPWLVVLIGFIIGSVFLFLGDKLFDYLLTKKRYKNDSRLKRCWMLVFSITLHNIPEGLAIGVAFGSVAKGNVADFMAALMLAIGIGIQNFPEGSAVSLPLRREGLSRFKSFMIGQLSGIVEPISAVIGCILVMSVVNVLPYFLAFAALLVNVTAKI